MSSTPVVFTHATALDALGGPLVVGALWEDVFLCEVMQPSRLDVYDGSRAAAGYLCRRLLNEMQLLIKEPFSVNVYPKNLRYKLNYPLVSLPKRTETLVVKEKCEQVLDNQLSIITELYPNYQSAKSRFKHAEMFYAELLKEGYNSAIHRRSSVWGLARWLYLNQSYATDRHLEMPLWWRKLFKSETDATTARDIITSEDRATKKHRRRRKTT